MFTVVEQAPVLVVDDEEISALLAERLLERARFIVVEGITDSRRDSPGNGQC
jgi:CheY-like chemotaxis protein